MKIKPCPYCGGSCVIDFYDSSTRMEYVTCSQDLDINCQYHSPPKESDEDVIAIHNEICDAIEYWRNRKPPITREDREKRQREAVERVESTVRLNKALRELGVGVSCKVKKDGDK